MSRLIVLHNSTIELDFISLHRKALTKRINYYLTLFCCALI